MANLLASCGAGGIELITIPASGWYWHDGTLSGDAALHSSANYLSTTKFSDGSSGDHFTYEEASSPPTGMTIRVIGPGTSLASLRVEMYLQGSLTWQAMTWNGSTYSSSGWTVDDTPIWLSPNWVTAVFLYSGNAPALAGYVDTILVLQAPDWSPGTFRVSDVRRS